MLSPVGAIEPDLLTIPQAAARLGVKRSTIYKLVATDELRRVHIGAGARITAVSIDRYLARIGARDPLG